MYRCVVTVNKMVEAGNVKVHTVSGDLVAKAKRTYNNTQALFTTENSTELSRAPRSTQAYDI